MSKTFRPYSPGQCSFLPPCPMDWLPKGHLALFVLDLVKELDLDGIYAHYERDLRGFPPYHPQMMVGLLLYAYCVGVPSSRKIEDGKPTGKSQRNFTDPESRIMKTGDGFIQGYNGQAMVDAEHQVIVAQAVTNQSPDVEHLLRNRPV